MRAAVKNLAGGLVRNTSWVFRRRPEKRGFLIPGYTGLGNFILKTPFIRELRRLYPEARIDVLCGNSFGTEHVLTGTDWVNEILMLPTGATVTEAVRFYTRLRGRYDTAFFFFDIEQVPHLYYGSILAGIWNRIGHIDPRYPTRVMVRSVLTETVPIRPKTHEIDLCFDLLDRVSPDVQRGYETSMSISGEYSEALKKELKAAGIVAGQYIVLQLSAGNGSKTPKVWPPKHFQELIGKLLETKARLIVLGDTREREIANHILAPFGNGVLDLTGKTSVREATLLIKSARGLVCHDSGLMHIGNALGVPLIAIFGPTDPWKNKPLGVKSHFVRRDLSCSPCVGINVEGQWSEAEAFDRCNRSIQCMRDIGPDELFEKMKAIFAI